MNKRVLLLGGSGLLGYHCSAELRADHELTSTWRRHPIGADSGVRLDALDNGKALCDLIEATEPDLVINTIAYVTVDGCETNPDLAKRLNVDFVRELVKALRDAGGRSSHLVHISSDSVYGQRNGDNRTPWREDDPKQPLSVYASTKLHGEDEALRHHGVVSVLRTAFYGINPRSEISLLWWIIENARQGHTIEGWENIFFSPISARRLAQGIRALFENASAGIYNAGSLDSCNKYDFVEAVCNYLDLPAKLNRTTSRQVEGLPVRPEYSVLDSSLLQKVIPWRVDWRDDLAAYLKNMPAFPKNAAQASAGSTAQDQ